MPWITQPYKNPIINFKQVMNEGLAEVQIMSESQEALQTYNTDMEEAYVKNKKISKNTNFGF